MVKAAKSQDLRIRLEKAKAPGSPPDIVKRARAGLLAYLDTAREHGASDARIARDLGDGSAAMRLAEALAEASRPIEGLACASGCAWCCLLQGEDGGTLSKIEAQQLHTALAPLQGQPDGRAWHPSACAALDPESRRCRVYTDRPLICRSYVSTDAAACEANTKGDPTVGAVLMSAQIIYLAALSLARDALGRADRMPTYSMAQVAKAAVEGADLHTALSTARHAPKNLSSEARRSARGYRRATPS